MFNLKLSVGIFLISQFIFATGVSVLEGRKRNRDESTDPCYEQLLKIEEILEAIQYSDEQEKKKQFWEEAQRLYEKYHEECQEEQPSNIRKINRKIMMAKNCVVGPESLLQMSSLRGSWLTQLSKVSVPRETSIAPTLLVGDLSSRETSVASTVVVEYGSDVEDQNETTGSCRTSSY